MDSSRRRYFAATAGSPAGRVSPPPPPPPPPSPPVLPTTAAAALLLAPAVPVTVTAVVSASSSGWAYVPLATSFPGGSCTVTAGGEVGLSQTLYGGTPAAPVSETLAQATTPMPAFAGTASHTGPDLLVEFVNSNALPATVTFTLASQ